MLKNCLPSILLAGLVAFGTQTASGQMVVHAVSGIVKTINPASKSIDVDLEDGSKAHFKTSSKRVPLSFDNDLRGDAVDASAYTQLDAFVVVYYYGFGDDRTAVAIKDLGKDTFQKFNGTVTAFDKHSRILTVKTLKAGTVKFHISEKAVIDTGASLQSGQKFSPGKGYTVRLTATGSGDEYTAVFIRSRR